MSAPAVGSPADICFVRYASLKGMVSLESKGLKGRAGPIRPKIAAELGLRPRAPYADFIAALQAKMDHFYQLKQKEESQ